ncbi:MAG: DUF2625 family protein [Ruminococcaceae bacterium]|nr:DUF2625 family protein [Oscillospiraceae bacterium]
MTFEEQFGRIQKMFGDSGCDIIVLPPNEEKARKVRSQPGDFSPLAAVLAGTGGVSVNGMLRLLGSGTIDFFERNQRLAETGMTIVAEDVFGGIFGLGKDGTLLYLAPDELAVEEFGDDYAELLEFACSSEDMDRFYRDYVKECPGVLFDQLPADKGVSLYPPLWEPSDEKRSAAAVPMKQLQDVEIGVMKKQAGQKDENDGGAEE